MKKVIDGINMIDNYHLGDSISILEKMDSESVDLIFTSCPDLSQMELNNIGGKDTEKYQAWQLNVMDQFARIVKKDGFVVVCQTDRKVNAQILTNHVTYINGLTKNGMIVKDEKILVRNSVGQRSMYYLSYQYMTILTYKGTFKRAGDFLLDIIVDKQVKCPPKSNQYCWSNEFCELVISNLTKEGDYVIDPFAACAPTLYAAKNLNRKYWGAEYDEKMYNKNFEYFGGRLPI